MPHDSYRFSYIRYVTPNEVLFVKCFGSRSRLTTAGKTDGAQSSRLTAFVDLETPADAPARQSIEMRRLMFYGQDDDVGHAEES